MQHSWVLHFTSGLSDTFLHSKCYDTNCVGALQYHNIRYADIHNSRYSMLLLCFKLQQNITVISFKLNCWIFKIFRASFDKRQSVIEYEIFMWKYEESLNGCFVHSPFPPAPTAKLKFASVLNSQYKVFLISIYCWSDVLTEKFLIRYFVRNCWSENF